MGIHSTLKGLYRLSPFTAVNSTLENDSQLVVQFFPQRGVAQRGTVVFCGEDGIDENPGQ